MAGGISRGERLGLVVGAIGALAAGAVAALVLQPWLLFVDVRVDDALPAVDVVTAAPVEETVADATAPATATPAPAPAGPVQLAAGTFISHEHETTGAARVIENPDGTHQLAIEGLSTSNGPDVHVWLSTAPVVEGFDGWFTAGGYPYVDLGPIKGNLGDQLYDIPADVDLSSFRTVELWCVQFAVSFGAAALT